MNLTYREFRASPALQSYVDTYWLLSFEGKAGEPSPGQYVVPHGTVEIVITLDDGQYDIGLNGEWYPLMDILIYGIYNNNSVMRTAGTTRKFGIRLKPETLHLLFNVPSSALYASYTHLENVVGNDANLFAEQLSEAPDTASLVACAEAFLLSQLSRRKQKHGYLIDAVSLIRASKGGLSMDAVCKSVYVSPRQLQRSFQQEIGFSPKAYQRLVRFRNVYRDMQRLKQAGGWAGLSYKLGYADQAHLIREFKEYTGLVPTELLLDKTHIFGASESGRLLASQEA